VIKGRVHVGTPWHLEFFRNLGCLRGSFTRYKHWELEHTYYSDALIDFDFEISRRTDHAGIEFGIGILGYGVAARIYDSRHWDSVVKDWEKHNV
jgi:hypothetical protein